MCRLYIFLGCHGTWYLPKCYNLHLKRFIFFKEMPWTKLKQMMKETESLSLSVKEKPLNKSGFLRVDVLTNLSRMSSVFRQADRPMSNGVSRREERGRSVLNVTWTTNITAPLTAWQSNVVALSVHMAQAETFEFGVEQGQMLQVLMRHCQTTKRQETRLRVATALLLATFFATLVWLQFHQQNTTVKY